MEPRPGQPVKPRTYILRFGECRRQGRSNFEKRGPAMPDSDDMVVWQDQGYNSGKRFNRLNHYWKGHGAK